MPDDMNNKKKPQQSEGACSTFFAAKCSRLTNMYMLLYECVVVCICLICMVGCICMYVQRKHCEV